MLNLSVAMLGTASRLITSFTALKQMTRSVSVLLAAFLVCVLLASACFAQAPTAQTLDTGARIHITVAGEPDVSGDYTLDSAGNVSLLYVNQVHLAGLTAGAAADKLASKDYLGKFYHNPQVVVTELGAGGITVEVDGAVTGQGPRLVRTDSRLNDVMQVAGPALDADLAGIKITHGIAGQTHTTDTVNYLAFLNSQDLTGNPALRDGDVIYVPRKADVAILIVVRGEVAKPGRLTLPATTTVADAIQAAGGVTPNADRSAIAVQHANTTQQIPINLDTALHAPTDTTANPVLLDGDIVIVKTAATPNVYTITGAVRQPGEYDLNQPNFSLAQAIGKAAGLSDRPKLKEITITRTPPGGRVQTIKLDASDPNVQAATLVQPGDNINIPQGSPGTRYDPLTIIGAVVSIIAIFAR